VHCFDIVAAVFASLVGFDVVATVFASSVVCAIFVGVAGEKIETHAFFLLTG
jgi:hypothetical protein